MLYISTLFYSLYLLLVLTPFLIIPFLSHSFLYSSSSPSIFFFLCANLSLSLSVSLSLSLSLCLSVSLSIYLSLPLYVCVYVCVSLSISLSSFLLRSHALTFFIIIPFIFYLSLFCFILLSLCYRNKESSQTPIEVETDGARSKDRKIQMTVNNEINSIEKSITNLDPARDQQIRQHLFKSFALFVSLELDLGLWLIFLYIIYFFIYIHLYLSILRSNSVCLSL